MGPAGRRRAAAPADAFEVFEHTADVGVRARADTWEGLLVQAARGMFSLIADPAGIRPAQTRRLEVSADGREDLMMAWLKALLAEFDPGGLVLSEFRILAADDRHLSAEVAGEPLDRDRHDPDLEVKAVTWHRFRVEQTSNGWEAEVVFDI